MLTLYGFCNLFMTQAPCIEPVWSPSCAVAESLSLCTFYIYNSDLTSPVPGNRWDFSYRFWSCRYKIPIEIHLLIGCYSRPLDLKLCPTCFLSFSRCVCKVGLLRISSPSSDTGEQEAQSLKGHKWFSASFFHFSTRLYKESVSFNLMCSKN